MMVGMEDSVLSREGELDTGFRWAGGVSELKEEVRGCHCLG